MPGSVAEKGKEMRITILGAGALGCYFGARLQSAGHDVAFVARGGQLAAMKTGGLRIESPSGDLSVDKVRAVATLAEAGPSDIVLLTLKNYDVEAAAAGLPEVMGAGSVVISVQNGVSAPALLAAKVGQERVLPGVVYLPAFLSAPGVVRVTAELQGLIFGEYAGPPTERTRAVHEALAVGGIRATVSEDIWRTMWEKFIFLSAFAAVTTVTRLDIGAVRETPATRALLRSLVDEAAAVAQAEHPAVPVGIADTSFDLMVDNLPPATHASMLDDLMRGKRLELEWLSGEVIRRGAKLGIETPAHGFAYAALAPYAEGPPGRNG